MNILTDSMDDPRFGANMALAAGLLQGNFGAGLSGFSNALAQGNDNILTRKMKQAQIANYESEVKQRDAATTKATELQAMVRNFLGGGQAGTNPDAFRPAGDGMGPSMPSQMQRAPGLAGRTVDEVAGLHAAGGPNLMDAFKWVNDPLKLEQGSTYVNRATGTERFMPKTDAGIVLNGNQASAIPGYAGAQASIEGAKTGAQEAAKAGVDLVKVTDSVTGADKWVTRAQAVQAAQPQPVAPARPSASEAMMRTQVSGDMGADPAAIQRELLKSKADLLRVPDASSKAMLQQHIADLERQAATIQTAGPLQASLTTNQRGAAKFSDDMAAKQADILDKGNTSAKAAADDLLGIQQSRKAIAGGVYMGSGAEAKLSIAKFVNANVPGVNFDPEKVANTDYLKSTLGHGLLEQAKTLGSNPSNADANRINDIVGSIGKDPKAMEKILDWRQDMALRSINGHNGRVDQAESSGYKSQFDLRVKNPLEGQSPANLVPSLPKNAPVGTRARDTTTGKILRFNGVSWDAEK